MPEKTVTEKMLIKPDKKLLVVGPPQQFDTLVGPLPEGVAMISIDQDWSALRLKVL